MRFMKYALPVLALCCLVGCSPKKLYRCTATVQGSPNVGSGSSKYNAIKHARENCRENNKYSDPSNCDTTAVTCHSFSLTDPKNTPSAADTSVNTDHGSNSDTSSDGDVDLSF